MVYSNFCSLIDQIEVLCDLEWNSAIWLVREGIIILNHLTNQIVKFHCIITAKTKWLFWLNAVVILVAVLSDTKEDKSALWF